MNEFQKYTQCGACGQVVDIAVPKSFCPFCFTPTVQQYPWVKPFAVGILVPVGFVGTPNFECNQSHEICYNVVGKDSDHIENQGPPGPLGRLTQELRATSAVSSSSNIGSPSLAFGTTTVPFAIPKI